MEKIELGTPDGAVENIEKIAELFPQVVTEVENTDGELARVVDFDALRDLLGDVAEGQRERYQFTWPGKREAKAEARRPIYKTMIPEPDKSKDWDTTENLYIEGDNLDALKILKETYAGKVKLIYIDPPYNTGHDFVYDDDFAMTRGEYDAESGDYDEEGGRLVVNTEGNGRFHSDWCSMMYPRLLLARDLLAADGAIFISIDDNEGRNLKAICDEVFGASSFVGQWAWYKSATPPNLSKKIKKNVEYVLCYEKTRTNHKFKGIKKESRSSNGLLNQTNKVASLCFPAGTVETGLADGPYKAGIYGTAKYTIELLEDTLVESGVFIRPVKLKAKFKWTQANLERELARGTVISIRTMTFSPSYEKKEYDPEVPPNLIDRTVGVGTTENAGKALDALFDGLRVFDYPKPVELINYIADFVCGDEDIILDFFSGSGTTAHACFLCNAKRNSRRRFILVQIPESLDEQKTNAKTDNARQIAENAISVCDRGGYAHTLCNIGEERIRRAGAQIIADIDKDNKQLELGTKPKPYPDLGFRVLRIDTSNFRDSYLTPGETEQAGLLDLIDNVKEGRSDLNLLFEVLPKLGIPYSAKIEEHMLAGKKVFFVDGDKLAACFDANVGSDTIEEMAKAKPWYAVIRDSSMADDATHANYEELFRTYSPDTVPQVI